MAPRPSLYPVALPNVKEDAERRARGVSIEDWLDAPKPPPRNADGSHGCDGKEAGCPALRCKFHLGRVGERAGFSCEWQIADMPDGDDPTAPCGERTFDLLARVIGLEVKRGQARQSAAGKHQVDRAFRKIAFLDDDTLRLLGISRELAELARAALTDSDDEE